MALDTRKVIAWTPTPPKISPMTVETERTAPKANRDRTEVKSTSMPPTFSEVRWKWSAEAAKEVEVRTAAMARPATSRQSEQDRVYRRLCRSVPSWSKAWVAKL